MMETIGFLELNSIARGVEAADAMVKAADVSLLFSKPSCPGKYTVLISGDVAAVQASIDAGLDAGKNNVVDKLVIPRVHPQLIKAINSPTYCEEVNAVGVMEYFSISASIVGADAAAKAAEVKVVDIRLGTGIGGKSFVVLTGEVAAVAEAVKSGTNQAIMNGMLIDSVVIPSPAKEVFECLM